jgi:hypothetical protein
MKNKQTLIISLIGFFALAFFLFQYTLSENKNSESVDGKLLFTSSVDDVQILYKSIDKNAPEKPDSELREFFSKDYTVLGRTPLRANLKNGTYYIVAKKFRSVPNIRKISVDGSESKYHFNTIFGYRYVGNANFTHRNIEYKIKPFFFAETELTNKAYNEFIEATGAKASFYVNDSRRNAPEQPVFGINYEEAVAYTKWLSEQTGRKCRLPYEHEWEYVASAGDTNKIYPWGNFERRQNGYMANYHPFNFQANRLEPINIDGYHYPAPVASFPATNKRFYDLAGNVLEWCLDTLKDKSMYPDYNLTKMPIEFARIVKGGSWNFNQRLMEIKRRIFVDGRIKEGNTGIRILVELD